MCLRLSFAWHLIPVDDYSLMKTLTILLANDQHFTFATDIDATLSASSQARLAQIVTPARRQQFVLGRWLMAQAANCDLGMIEETDRYPIFAGQADWHASISHSGPYLAAVFNMHSRYGLDIEYPMRARDWAALAKRAFSAAEAAWILAAQPEVQAERFYRIWTLREAACKSGLLDSVVSQEAIFDPLTSLQVPNWHWQYRQHGQLHISVAGPEDFSIQIREISAPD